MELPQSNTLLPVCSYTRTELLSLRTKTSLLSLSFSKLLQKGYKKPSRRSASSCAEKKKKKKKNIKHLQYKQENKTKQKQKKQQQQKKKLN